MEEEKTESYRALYRVRPLIYHIGDIRLWMPIRQDAVVLWLVYIVVFFVFCYVFPILSWVLPFDRIITMVAGPIAAAYYTVKLDPAGKTVPRYLRDVLHFLVRPKWMVRWQSIRQPGGKRRLRAESWCRPYDRIPLKNDGEEWYGRSGFLQGRVEGLRSMVLPANSRVMWHGRSKCLQIVSSKKPPRHALSPPAVLEYSTRGRLRWTTAEAVQVQRENGFENREIWKVEERKGPGKLKTR
ncbi:TcpE family conjugal transfer membrane protein [Paenibacillus sp. S150]|uniref:TcpE family conjugal transfer membrane protein n=1 Tax=Paenibacillus sp. S150 TaxID=2749826 RepID=UPI001C59DE3C|nr:TcpE family conjugal transfer membrane protein [Paenibacillus sp. S150]MBW4081286.1 hypothetical protein [Paenibacillus sp. S150]